MMNCMSYVTYSFNINGDRVGYIQPSRGIRQGDPLSPFLFFIGVEDLSSMMNFVGANKSIMGVKSR